MIDDALIDRLKRALEPFAEAGGSESAKHNDLAGALSTISLVDLWNARTAYDALSRARSTDR